jgi:hypothetical protein
LVVDGIDECEDREDLLACLSVIGYSGESSAIHVFATSRPESDISRSFSNFANIKIHPSDAKSDIRGYIAKSMKTIQISGRKRNALL